MATIITGANGFLGSYLCKVFAGEDLLTLGLSGCTYNVNLATTIPRFNGHCNKVVHAAGLAHVVPKSKQTGSLFFDVNVTGTANLLQGLENLSALPQVFVFISTVAVYGLEQGELIDESAPLHGISPYALSKIQAEEMIRAWGHKNGVKTLVLRLPLIAGANAPGNLGAMIQAIRKGYYFRTGDGSARRSMVLAEDVAHLIRNCARCEGTYNLTDGYHPSIRELDEYIASVFGTRIKTIPAHYARLAAKAGDLLPFMPWNSRKLEKLSRTLTFSDEKARRELGWNPRPVIGNIW